MQGGKAGKITSPRAQAMQKIMRRCVLASVSATALLLAACCGPRGWVMQPSAPAQPLQVAPTPAPALETSRMNLSADAVFAFGKSDIASVSDEGRDQLDRLVKRLHRIRDIRAVHLVGYTDRIGGDAYNDALSRRRAEAVRGYLVAHGVSDEVITTEGRGAADPLVTCPDLSGNRLRACLAPNRRVAVSIVAMRQIER